jgi:hypothetical protein
MTRLFFKTLTFLTFFFYTLINCCAFIDENDNLNYSFGCVAENRNIEILNIHVHS